MPPPGAAAPEPPPHTELPDPADASTIAGAAAVTGFDGASTGVTEQKAASSSAPEPPALPTIEPMDKTGGDAASVPGSDPALKPEAKAFDTTRKQPDSAKSVPATSRRAKRGVRQARVDNATAPSRGPATVQQPQRPSAWHPVTAEGMTAAPDDLAAPRQPLQAAADAGRDDSAAADASVAAEAEVPPPPARTPPSAKGKRTRLRHAPTRFLPTFAPDRPAQRRSAADQAQAAADAETGASQLYHVKPQPSGVPRAKHGPQEPMSEPEPVVDIAEAQPGHADGADPAADSVAAAAPLKSGQGNRGNGSSGVVGATAKRCVCSSSVSEARWNTRPHTRGGIEPGPWPERAPKMLAVSSAVPHAQPGSRDRLGLPRQGQVCMALLGRQVYASTMT